jgi:hypothetical protein
MSAVKTLKANTEAKDFVGNTPLHYGAIHYNVDAQAWLLLKGANPRAKNDAGQTFNDVDDGTIPSIGRLGRELYEFIINPTSVPAGLLAAERMANEPEEDWVIRSLARNVTTYREGFNDEEVIIAMVNTREAADGNEFPPLQIAAELGHVAWVKALIRAGANPERVPEKIEYKPHVTPDVRAEINRIITAEKAAFAAKEQAILEQYTREASLEAERNRAVTAATVIATAPGGSPLSTAARCITDGEQADVSCAPQQLFAGLNPLNASLAK